MARTCRCRPMPPAESAGVDLMAAAPSSCWRPGAHAAVPTGIRLALPAGMEGQVRPRSGLALRHGVTVLNAPGTIDADYRGEVKVMLVNHGSEPMRIERGMRDRATRVRAGGPCDLGGRRRSIRRQPRRGEGGFGSTGSCECRQRPAGRRREGAMLRAVEEAGVGAGSGDRHRLPRRRRAGAEPGHRPAAGNAAALSGAGDAATGARRHPAGVRGPRGGYRLARERRRITVGQIVRVVQGSEESAEDSATVSEFAARPPGHGAVLGAGRRGADAAARRR